MGIRIMTTNNSTDYVPVQYNVLVGSSNNISSIAPPSLQVLRTVMTSAGASANPAFSNAPTVSYSIVRQVFTSSGTYTPTTNMKYCIIECVGGGGGGGSTGNAVNPTFACTGGGGAGSYSKGVYSAATVGASQVVTIGAGGIAASNGGTSSVGALISSPGGTGAVSVASAGNVFTSAGGAGGTSGAGGSFYWQGYPGYASRGVRTAAINLAVSSGKGGSSFFGGAGGSVGTNVTTPTTFTSNGTAATSYGGGGSGGVIALTAGSTTGGSGFAGIIIITEFVTP